MRKIKLFCPNCHYTWMDTYLSWVSKTPFRRFDSNRQEFRKTICPACNKESWIDGKAVLKYERKEI